VGEGAIEGGCQCGAVTIRLARRPDYVNDCNCSSCRPLGVLWGYFSLAGIEPFFPDGRNWDGRTPPAMRKEASTL